MKQLKTVLTIFGAMILIVVFLVAANNSQVQAQNPDIVGTWNIGADVVASFHADGTLITVTAFSLTHPDTPQIGIWWQEGDVIRWMEQGFTIAGENTVTVKVTGTVQIISPDEISIDPYVEIGMPNGSVVVDDGPPATGTRMQPAQGS